MLKTIPGFSNYMISEDGKTVYSIKRDKEIAHAISENGYEVVTITDDDGYRAPRKVHRLVYLTYVGELIPGMTIDHIDNDPMHNHYTNLQQISQSENSMKSFTEGKNKDKAVWDKGTVDNICRLLAKNTSEHDIFRKLKIDYDKHRVACNHLVGQLLRGDIHKDITAKYDLSGYINGINKKDRKLTIDQVSKIYEDTKFGGIPAFRIAKQYQVTYSTICKIRDKKTWKSVTDSIDDKHR